jgi:AraC-like DNA-binding protein
MDKEYCSESWLAHHVKKLQLTGFSNEDCNNIVGFNVELLSQPIIHKKIPIHACRDVTRLLYESGYQSKFEIPEIVESFQHVDLFKAFLINSSDLDTLLLRVQCLASIHLGGCKYEFQKRNNKLYIYFDGVDNKSSFMTPQGHFAFLFKILESAFFVGGGALDAEIGIVQHALPSIDVFSRLISSKIRCRVNRSYISFSLNQLHHKNPKSNPMVDGYLVNELSKFHSNNQSGKNEVMDDVRRIISVRMNGDGGELSVDSVSNAMGISRSTLYRYLSEYDMTFSQLLDSERKANALSLVKNKSMTMGEISDCLGYANLSAFNRAFKRWFNTNPTSLM